MFYALLYVSLHYFTLYSIFFYSFYLTMTDTKSTAAADAKKVEDASVEKTEEAKTTDDSKTEDDDSAKTDTKIDEPAKEEDSSKTDDSTKTDEPAKTKLPESPEPSSGEKKRASPLAEEGAPDSKKASVDKLDDEKKEDTEEPKADVAATPEGDSSDKTECPTDEKKADEAPAPSVEVKA